MVKYEDYTTWADFVRAVMAAGYTSSQITRACKCDRSVVRRWSTAESGTRHPAYYAMRIEMMQAVEDPLYLDKRKKPTHRDIVPAEVAAPVILELYSRGWTRSTLSAAVGILKSTITHIVREKSGTKQATYDKLLALREVDPPVVEAKPKPVPKPPAVRPRPAIFLTEEGEALFKREMLIWAEMHPERMAYSREYYLLYRWMRKLSTSWISPHAYQRLARALVSLDMEDEIIDLEGVACEDGYITDPDVVCTITSQVARLLRVTRVRNTIYERSKLSRTMMAVKRGDIMTSLAARNVFDICGDVPDDLKARILSMVTPDREGCNARKEAKLAAKRKIKHEMYDRLRAERQAREEKRYTFVDIVDDMVIPDAPPRREGYDFFGGLPYPEEAPWLYRVRRAS